MNPGRPRISLVTSRLVLIRHGETEWNVSWRYQGQADPALTAEGLAQAAEAARLLGRARLEVIYTSPLRRAADTAAILGEALHLPVRPDPRLMEIHLGRWQGMLHDEIVRADPALFQRWLTAPLETTPPGGERLEQVRQRVYEAIDEILVRQAGQRIAVVTHRIPIILLCSRYFGTPAEEIHSVQVPNTSWVSMDLRDGRLVGRPRRGGRVFVDGSKPPLV